MLIIQVLKDNKSRQTETESHTTWPKLHTPGSTLYDCTETRLPETAQSTSDRASCTHFVCDRLAWLVLHSASLDPVL